MVIASPLFEGPLALTDAPAASRPVSVPANSQSPRNQHIHAGHVRARTPRPDSCSDFLDHASVSDAAAPEVLRRGHPNRELVRIVGKAPNRVVAQGVRDSEAEVGLTTRGDFDADESNTTRAGARELSADGVARDCYYVDPRDVPAVTSMDVASAKIVNGASSALYPQPPEDSSEPSGGKKPIA